MELFLAINELSVRDIELYYQLNEQEKELKKKLDMIKLKIKTAMLNNNIDVIDTGTHTVSITNSFRKHIDEDKLVNILYSKGLYEALEIVRKPIYSEVEWYLQYGLLDKLEYDSCITVTTIHNLNVKHNL